MFIKFAETIHCERNSVERVSWLQVERNDHTSRVQTRVGLCGCNSAGRLGPAFQRDGQFAVRRNGHLGEDVKDCIFI